MDFLFIYLKFLFTQNILRYLPTTTENPPDKKSPLAMIPPNKPINTRKAPIESNNIRTIFSFFIPISDIIIYTISEMRTSSRSSNCEWGIFYRSKLTFTALPKILAGLFSSMI